MNNPITVTTNDAGEILSVNWEEFLLQELETPSPQKEVAKTYSYLLRTKGTNANWRKINEAIIKRWSPAGLARVKELAWRFSREAQIRGA